MILLNIRKIIDDYVECNSFELKIKDKKVYVYYYEKIKHFSNNKVIISYKDEDYIIIGKKLVIETLQDEFILINGLINSIEINNNE